MRSFKEFINEKTYAKSGLGKWFNQQSAGGGAGWDRYGTTGTKLGKCGDAKEGEPYSACLSRQKAEKLGKKGIASFVRRKRKAQKDAGRDEIGSGGKGKKPINVKTGVTDKDPKKRGIQDAVKLRVDSDLEVLVVQDKDGNAAIYKSMKDAKKKAKEISGKVIRGRDGQILVQVLKDPSLRKQGVMQEKNNPRIPRKKGQPAGSDKHSDLYTDENPKDTIHGLGFKDVETARASIKKIEASGRKHAHKVQAAIAMEQRAREMGKKKEAAVYRTYIEKMKKKTKAMRKYEDWSEKYKKSIDCDNPKGFSQKAHCAGRKKNEEALDEKNVPVNPSLWKKAIAKAKQKFDVYPSAYANAWASKWYKSQGGKWTTKESVELDECSCGCNTCDDTTTEAAEYQGREVKLNDPFRLPTGSKKKFGVYVKNEKGNVVKVTFGDPNMDIKRDDPGRRSSFRARHNCDNPGPKYKARYWSCYQWRAGAKVDN